MNTTIIPVLYYIDSLPYHWIYQDETGNLWKFPASPISPEALAKKEPFLGRWHGLRIARPQKIAEFYWPGSDQPVVS